MFQSEPPLKEDIVIRPIRMLPFALTAALAVYGIAWTLGAGETMSPLFAAIAGGWTLGHLTRRREQDV